MKEIIYVLRHSFLNKRDPKFRHVLINYINLFLKEIYKIDKSEHFAHIWMNIHLYGDTVRTHHESTYR
jgi:hypothetical protein